ncbi:hypothetical protein C5C36_13720 [Rathayibacter sp. AY1G1]|nr:hypothetical protein C5C33_14255 [Rathayibacter sp. AY1H3]PPH10623.1 hypothetical protein C5C36_13720 [Rathayibacter sp. AY1G1]PPH35593.1 hypothetical protein C5C86_16710 [Rathayibacter sp. AY1E4]
MGSSSARSLPASLRVLRVLGQVLLILVVVAALLLQFVASLPTLGRVLGDCFSPGYVPAEAYWYAVAIVVIATGVWVASERNRATGHSRALAFTLLTVGILGAAVFTFVAFLGAAFWEMARENDNLSSADGWGQFGVFVAAYATPAFALILAASLMLVRRRAAPVAIPVPPITFLAVVIASLAFQIIRSSVVC